MQATLYTMQNGEFFRKGLPPHSSNAWIKNRLNTHFVDVHWGICGMHLGAQCMVARMPRQYIIAHIEKRRSLAYHKVSRMSTFWPLTLGATWEVVHYNCSLAIATWEMKKLDHFPLAMEQVKFLVVAINYFTKMDRGKTTDYHLNPISA